MKKIIGLALTTLVVFGTICSCQGKKMQNTEKIFCCYDKKNSYSISKIGKTYNSKVHLFNIHNGQETEIDFPDKEMTKIIKGIDYESQAEWYYTKKGKICHYKNDGNETKIDELVFDDNLGKVINANYESDEWLIVSKNEKSITFYLFDYSGKMIANASRETPKNYDEIYSGIYSDMVYITSGGRSINYSFYFDIEEDVEAEVEMNDMIPELLIPTEYDEILSTTYEKDNGSGILYIKDNALYTYIGGLKNGKISSSINLPDIYKVPVRNKTVKKNSMDFMIYFCSTFPNSDCKILHSYEIEDWEGADEGLIIFTNDYDVFRILKYNTKDPSSKALLDNIKKNGGISILGTIMPAIVNGELVLVDYKDCDEKDRIVKTFKDFK